jgi:hypothetical protein
MIFVAVQRPSRGSEETPELTEEVKDAASASFRQLLSRSIKLTQIPSSLSFLGSLSVIYREGEFLVNNVPWSTFRHLQIDFPQYSLIDDNYKVEALTKTNNGVTTADWQAYINTLSDKVRQRAIFYLRGKNHEIELFHIGRDGKGTEYAVTPEDTAVFDILLRILCLVSCSFRVGNS